MTPKKSQMELSRQKRESDLGDVARENSGRLSGIIGRTLKDRNEAEDILQDVFETYIETYDVGDVIDSASAWLATVARNKVLDRFRKKKTVETHAEDVRISSGPESGLSHDDGPDTDFERMMLREELSEAIEALPPEQKSVFIQQELEGKTFEQISQESGVNINTLLARKRYAIQFLQDYLKETYDELD